NLYRFTRAGVEVSALLGRMPSAVGYQPTLPEETARMQERITSTKTGSITSVQAIYVPADDLTDPAPATTFGHLDATVVLSRDIASLGIYPAVDPLDSTSRQVDPNVIGEEHYGTTRAVQATLQRYKELRDIIAILGMDELSPEDKLAVAPAPRSRSSRARRSSSCCLAKRASSASIPAIRRSSRGSSQGRCASCLRAAARSSSFLSPAAFWKCSPS